MKELSKDSKVYLLKLARAAIKGKFTGELLTFGELPGDIKKQGGVFITLNKEGSLRGCIGNIEARDEIYKAVVRNAEQSAFHDPRFPPLEESELDDINIEISILSKPVQLKFKDPEELVKKIEKNKPGLILEFGWNKATYLPQVWEQIPDAERFLSSLCMKAGLPESFWKEKYEDLSVFEYESAHFSEAEIENKGQK